MKNIENNKLKELTEKAIEAMRTVHDPEIPVNIYDLGLIYKIDFQVSKEESRFDAEIDMTLTTANCPLADEIPVMVKDALVQIPDLNEVVVNLVWEPPWDTSRMSEEARFELDMF